MAKTSPTSRTLQHLKKFGYPIGKTEHWQQIPNHPAGGIRQDLFNFIDMIYLTSCDIVAVQCTSGSNHSARVEKILGLPAARAWLKAGGLTEVWSWSKKGPRGERKVWTEKIQAITESDFLKHESQSHTPPESEDPF